MSASQKSLYERIGGDIAIALLIDRFYDRVLKDPELEPFFRQVSMEKLREMQLEFFAAALGGPVTYTGKPLEKAHKGRGVSSRHLSRFMTHLVETIRFAHPDESEVSEMYSRITLYGDMVLDNPMEGTEQHSAQT